jgi:amino acid transporter
VTAVKYVQFYLPHIILFSVFLIVLTVVLYYYRRRHSNPRFRPGAGEIMVIAIIAIVVGGYACYGLGNVFRGDLDFNLWKGTVDHGAGWSEGDSQSQPADSRYSN